MYYLVREKHIYIFLIALIIKKVTCFKNIFNFIRLVYKSSNPKIKINKRQINYTEFLIINMQ
jgi:hypothetical protein